LRINLEMIIFTYAFFLAFIITPSLADALWSARFN